ncbi:MAG: Bax inhibitor-1/YccA family protein [Phycisphaerae bacterium]
MYDNTIALPQQQQYAAVMALRQFMVKTYGWMAFALTITACVALFTAFNPAMRNIVFSHGVFIGLIIGELALVLILSAAIRSLSPALATALFVIYSAVNGLTLSVIFLVYELGTIYSAFFITSGMFAVMAVYGSITRRDLTSIGNLCFMALIGLIIASVVNLFWASSALYWLVTYAGVFIFVGLTAYDAQKVKMMAISAQGENVVILQKAAIMGALALYLDFINLLLFILRLLDRRK